MNGRSKSRIAHILPFPSVGGTEVGTLRIIRAAERHGFGGLVYHRAAADAVRRFFQDEGVETRPFEPVEPSYRRPLPFMKNSVLLAREFRAQRVSAVHSADLPGAYFAGYGARLAGLPLLCHVRNRYSELPLRDRSFLLPVQQFVFVSKHTWTSFNGRVPPGRGRVLYDGIPIPDRSRARDDRESVRRDLGIPAAVPVVGMVARVAPQKDFPTLIQAARRVLKARPDTRFVVIGDTATSAANRDHYADVLARADSAGVRESFLFTGQRTDVERFYGAMDVFVLSTHWEGLPLVILEAMAHGLPVVATGVDGVPELVVEGETGFLCDHEDAECMAKRVIGLVDNPELARTLGEASRRRVEADFSAESFERRVTRMYEAIVPSHRRTA